MKRMTAINTSGSFQDASAKYMGCCATYHDLITIANASFGTNCWSHSITRQDIDYLDVNNDKYAVGVVAFVNIVTKDGVHHEEMGYGMCSCVDNKGIAILTARKEAAKNALKEALKCFGGTILTRVNEVDARDEQMPHGMSLIWTGGNYNASKLIPSPVLNRSSEKPKESASAVKNKEQVTPLKKAAATEEERRRQERIDRQRQKQEEFRKRLKQNEIPKCEIADLTNWDDDYIPGDSFVSMPEEQLAVPLSTAAPCNMVYGDHFSPTGQENRITNQNRRTPLGVKRNMSMGLVGAGIKQNRV